MNFFERLCWAWDRAVIEGDAAEAAGLTMIFIIAAILAAILPLVAFATIVTFFPHLVLLVVVGAIFYALARGIKAMIEAGDNQ